MLMISLLLILVLNPAQLAGAIINGCFTKERWQVYQGISKFKYPKEVASLADCALHCSTDLDWCDGFTFHSNNSKGSPNCFPKQGARLGAQDPSTREVMIAGWCPNNKGLSTADRQSIQPSPLQCSSQGDICQFPVKVSGVLHWDCVDRKGVKVCNTRDPQGVGGDIQTFDNTDSFKPCQKCKPACIGSNLGYGGFALHNQNRENIYKKVESESDCQQICQVAEGCNFFNFNSREKECKLKYGVGQKAYAYAYGNFFGPKFCPVDCVAGNSTRSPGPCKAACGANGTRTVSLTPVVESPAQHGGEECRKGVVEVVEDCTGECGITTATLVAVTVSAVLLAILGVLLAVCLWRRRTTPAPQLPEQVPGQEIMHVDDIPAAARFRNTPKVPKQEAPMEDYYEGKYMGEQDYYEAEENSMEVYENDEGYENSY